MKIILATHNDGKVAEMRAVFAATGLPVEIISLNEIDPKLDLPEPHQTYIENARAKAMPVAEKSLAWALADDSGLEIDALNGEPGIHSARYGGEGLTMKQRCELILQKLEGVPHEKRTARFKAVLVLMHPEEAEYIFQGVWEGFIAEDMRGDKGFGYDPIFIDASSSCRAAEMEKDEKNAISHRGLALTQLSSHLKNLGL